VSCTWSNADGSRTTTAIVRRDTSPPRVSATADRGPDANGWYSRAVGIQFTGDDATSGVASCTSGTYSGPDSAAARASGSCTDWAGNTGSTTFELRYDATAPSVEAKADRPPNAKGWYNRSVTVAFLGSDAVSGVDVCDAPVLYKGPDAAKATVSGTCSDKASNKSAPTGLDLKYDTAPPKLGKVRAVIDTKAIVLRWTASPDTYSVAVVRRPGLRSQKPSTLFNRRGRAFADRRVKSGVKYRYTVTAYDEAGNGAAKALAAQLGAGRASAAKAVATRPAATRALTRPARDARVSAPPTLVWPTVREATYYNVQLYRGSTKILSVWPRTTRFQLQPSWRFGGRGYRLAPGRYRWYVWPGLGPLSANKYGKRIVSRDFVLTR